MLPVGLPTAAKLAPPNQKICLRPWNDWMVFQGDHICGVLRGGRTCLSICPGMEGRYFPVSFKMSLYDCNLWQVVVNKLWSAHLEGNTYLSSPLRFLSGCSVGALHEETIGWSSRVTMFVEFWDAVEPVCPFVLGWKVDISFKMSLFSTIEQIKMLPALHVGK